MKRDLSCQVFESATEDCACECFQDNIPSESSGTPSVKAQIGLLFFSICQWQWVHITSGKNALPTAAVGFLGMDQDPKSNGWVNSNDRTATSLESW